MVRIALLRPVFETACDLIFPPHCATCDTAVESSQWLCTPCAEKVRPIRRPYCEHCAHPLSGESGMFTCPNCKGRPFHFEFAMSYAHASGTTRELIHQLKYGRQQRLAALLGGWVADLIETDARLAEFEPDALIPVPLHGTRRREREFNQSELIARAAAKRLGIPARDMLRRRRHTDTQTRFDRRHRMQNLRDAFILSKNAPVENLRFILVDDVLTTGATIDECARVLLEAGASAVCAVTVARG